MIHKMHLPGTTKALLLVTKASTMRPFKLMIELSRLILNMQMPGTTKVLLSKHRASTMSPF